MSKEKKYKCHMCGNWFPMKDLRSHFNISRLCPDCWKFYNDQWEDEQDFFRKVDEIQDPNTSDERRNEIFDEFSGDETEAAEWIIDNKIHVLDENGKLKEK